MRCLLQTHLQPHISMTHLQTHVYYTPIKHMYRALDLMSESKENFFNEAELV